jgi:hypothetical protein
MRVWIIGAAVLSVASFVAFWFLFDPNMLGQERALMVGAAGSGLAGLGVALLLTTGRPRLVMVIATAVLLGAAVFGAMTAGDLRTDRGNKKALIALVVGAASGAGAVTAILVAATRRRTEETAPLKM